MSAKYSFQLQSRDRQRALPHKIILGQQETETITHVALKFLAYVIFFRERLQVETNVNLASIPFTPDLVELDYELRPKLWVECGECGVGKLHKLAVRCPEAEIWIMKRSAVAAEHLLNAMTKEELRRNRYHIIGLEAAMFNEFCGLLRQRNEFLWVSGGFEPPNLQFDFNGLWFDMPFMLLHY